MTFATNKTHPYMLSDLTLAQAVHPHICFMPSCDHDSFWSYDKPDPCLQELSWVPIPLLCLTLIDLFASCRGSDSGD